MTFISAASSLTTAQTEIERQKAELAELRSRLTQSQSQAEHERKRCDEEQRAAERMRLSNDELRGEIKVLLLFFSNCLIILF